MIVAAIPCHNESKYIGSVVLKTKHFVDQVLVIDDGCEDKTAEVAKSAGAIVISHSRNRGKGTAIKSALTWARNNGYNTLVLLDGDGQHDPAEMPKLLKPIEDGEADMVIGSRFLGNKNNIPFYRRLGLHALNFATNLGCRIKLTDSQSGFRAFSARAINEMDFSENSYSAESDMQIAASRLKLRCLEVPISVRYFNDKDASPLAHGFGVLSRIITILTMQRPLLLFGLPALILLLSGIGLGAYTVSIYNSTGNFAIGYSIGALFLCLTGLLLGFFAVMLRSIKEIFAA